MENQDLSTSPAAPIFIISGGAGALGKHVARIALSQFPLDKPEVIVLPQICQIEQLTEAIEQVDARGGAIIIHTVVEPTLRKALQQMAAERNIRTVDTVSDVLAHMSAVFGREPLGQQGIYYGQEEAYVERIKAIEYTVDHDDGRNPEEWHEADVVLAGVSRVGKTPLSIYLSVLGWKVANIPLVPGLPPPEQLFQIDRRRVIGLIIDPTELAAHRNWRQLSMGGTAGRAYTDASKLYEELDMARQVFRRGGFAVVDVTSKPVEESADEIIARITRWFERKVKLSPIAKRE
jgi:regulator of PEP synthase PpsR (kinase-PPPase family)